MFDDLVPVEVLSIIVAYLEPSAYFRARQSCSLWRQVCKSQRLEDSFCDKMRHLAGTSKTLETFESILKNCSFFLQFYTRPLDIDLATHIDDDGILRMLRYGHAAYGYETTEQLIWCALDNSTSLHAAKEVFVGTSSEILIFERGPLKCDINIFESWRILYRTKIKIKRPKGVDWRYECRQCTKNIIYFTLRTAPCSPYVYDVIMDRQLQKVLYYRNFGWLWNLCEKTATCTFSIGKIGEHLSCILGKPGPISDDFNGKNIRNLISYWEYSFLQSNFWLKSKTFNRPIPLAAENLILGKFNEIWSVEGLPGLSYSEWHQTRCRLQGRSGQALNVSDEVKTTTWVEVVAPTIRSMRRPTLKQFCRVPVGCFTSADFWYDPTTGYAVYSRITLCGELLEQRMVDLSEEALEHIKRDGKFKIYKGILRCGRTRDILTTHQELVLEQKEEWLPYGHGPSARLLLIPISKHKIV